MKNCIKKSLLLLLIFSLLFTFSCKKKSENENSDAPSLTTLTVTNITKNSASSGGAITSEGGSALLTKGVCWSTSQNPTTSDNHTDEGSGTSNFTSSITALNTLTMYYVRAYATNEFGTSYGNQLSFTTKDGSIKDGDGNIYTAISIGMQEWLTENLKTTSYLNGDAIGTTPVFTTDISGETSPKYQWAYDGDTANVSIYGRLYTWYALKDSRGVCPEGWHVATDTDWNTLITYLGGDSVAGGKLKETGTTHWFSPNANADNSSGFNALPAGSRMGGDLGYTAIWWSATERISTAAWWYKTFYNEARTNRSSMGKSSGLSCRCVKD